MACERSDVLSGAGGSVVTDMDLTLTDMQRGFLMLNLGPGAVAGSFSLPAEADPAFSTQGALPYVLIGINQDRDGDTLAAQMGFKAVHGAKEYTKDDAENPVAYLYFLAADTIGALSEPVVVFSSEPLGGMRPVDREDRGDTEFLDDDGEVTVGDNRIDSFEISGGIDSVPLPAKIAREIFDIRVSTDSTAAYAFAFSIVNYHGPLRKLHNPYVILHVNKNGTIVRDSIAADTTRFTAFEKDAAIRAGLPYSSHHTLRTTVFKIDVGTILDSLYKTDMTGAKGELINAVLALSVNRNDGGGEDAEELSGSLISHNVNSYRLVISNIPPENMKELPNDIGDTAAVRNSLRGQFAAAPSTTPGETLPFRTHNIKPLLREVVLNAKFDGAGTLQTSPYIYVYLRPFMATHDVDGSTILWHAPPKLETVFTPSRSQ